MKIAIFASGRGSNFQSIHGSIRKGYIPAEIILLIVDNENAGAIHYAQNNEIPVVVLKPKDFPSSTLFGEALLAVLIAHRADFAVLAGYLKKIPENVIAAYANRIVNIHPALLPAFGGKGMYGINVHRAVYEAGVKISGVTVHFVDHEYDRGPIILQKAVDIEMCQSPQEIASTVLAEEHRLFSDALKLIVEHEIVIDGKRVRIGKKKND